MGRIYFNCNSMIQLCTCMNKQLHNLSSRQLIVLVTVFILLGILVFLSIDIFVFSYDKDAQDLHIKRPLASAPTKIDFGPNVHFGIVIDCGSSGSRIFIYFWPPHSGNPSDLLSIQQLMDPTGKPVVKKISPGLDTFEKNPGAASDYINPLLKYAASHIPSAHHADTQLFILATAGMRMIPQESQKAIFEDLKNDIPKSFPFVFSDSNFEVISGKLEGVYAWIAVNYVLQKFGHGEEEHPLVWVESLKNEDSSARPHMRRRTVGMLDMGGGSFQIAFEVTGKDSSIPKHRIAEFNLGCQNNDLDHTYKVYVTTFLGFGANEAEERYEEMLVNKASLSIQKEHEELVKINKSEGIHPFHHHRKVIIKDPCLPEDLSYEIKKGYVLEGAGNYSACQHSLTPLLNRSRLCEQDSCSMNGVHQPEIIFRNSEFYGFSEFWYTMQDVFRIGGLYYSKRFEEEAKRFCSTNWMTLQSWYEQKLFPQADEKRFRQQCFKASWITTVLHEGLKFPKSYHSLRSVQYIQNKEVQWTLGALLHRTRYLPLRDIEKTSQTQKKHTWTLRRTILHNEYLIILCFIIVITAITLYVKRLKLCPKADLSRVPSMSYFMTEEGQNEPGVRYGNAYQYP
ncbi:ectonucleoside triphosphate diphosphohydrolase 7-like [Mytilus edulis]|uniref:ectonucleoside triphosphate diphosphohydrolase 7-like n=1 Tax=Mytilus edulis TaxID=6550 RepID=UPI0039EE50C6